MPNLAIAADKLTKQYRKGELSKNRQRSTLAEAITNAIAAPLRNLRTLRDLGSTASRPHPTITWALRDVSFLVSEGEALGIVGRNGAGKSTLLKILSRITEPTSGRADVYGRVGSLLEVGTGFHPDLTGRQNVYLNGSILGMSRGDVGRRFDEIVDFAGVGPFIDTPVKRYSSGMQARLAFAVAAHFEPDILIVDEVLAVGDAEFQRKCLAKIDDVATGGRTVLFVSHNLNAVQRLCNRCMWLDGGRVVADGSTADVIHRYLRDGSGRSVEARPDSWIDLRAIPRQRTREASFEWVRYTSNCASVGGHAYSDGPVTFTVAVQSDAARRIDTFAVTFYDEHGTRLVNADVIELGCGVRFEPGLNTLSICIRSLHLRPGTYVVGLWAAEATGRVYDHVPSALTLEVLDVQPNALGGRAPGLVTCDFTVEYDTKVPRPGPALVG